MINKPHIKTCTKCNKMIKWPYKGQEICFACKHRVFNPEVVDLQYFKPKEMITTDCKYSDPKQ